MSTETGIYKKFYVERLDGKSNYGQKHYNCDYFVLDLIHDPYALPALEAYAEACRDKYPFLALDIFKKIQGMRSEVILNPQEDKV